MAISTWGAMVNRGWKTLLGIQDTGRRDCGSPDAALLVSGFDPWMVDCEHGKEEGDWKVTVRVTVRATVAVRLSGTAQ